MAECLHSEDVARLPGEEDGEERKHEEGSYEQSVDEDSTSSGRLWHYTRKIGTSSYNALHWAGGKFAYWFGISTPEWQYAIDVHEDTRRKKEAEKREEEKMIREIQESVANRLSDMESARPLEA